MHYNHDITISISLAWFCSLNKTCQSPKSQLTVTACSAVVHTVRQTCSTTMQAARQWLYNDHQQFRWLHTITPATAGSLHRRTIHDNMQQL